MKSVDELYPPKCGESAKSRIGQRVGCMRVYELDAFASHDRAERTERQISRDGPPTPRYGDDAVPFARKLISNGPSLFEVRNRQFEPGAVEVLCEVRNHTLRAAG